ncbi:hypothetical protein Agub_g7715 [Astrephomene gubernaculifera]|uniref:MADS-box domain-containing protein n=1 Tax=Astrephomene gubernaculifera TaxID=47775 RepID=A0AAD3DUP2_9CHLO|nr:hypothetical protein Agub_g7715 [Astrephomene gubernaculifera]
MTRNKVQFQRITDDASRQAMFARRKQGLMRKAMELSVLCDCDVALIIFGPGSGSGSGGPGAGGAPQQPPPPPPLYQYSSVGMDELLERYAAAVSEPHERRRNGELLRHYYGFPAEEGGREGEPSSLAAAASLGAADGIMLGPGGMRREEAAGWAKRMRTPSPGLGGRGGGEGELLAGPAGGPAAAAAGAPGAFPLGGAPLLGGLAGTHAGAPSSFLPGSTGAGGLGAGGPAGLAGPGGGGTPLRRVAVVGGGGLGPALPLEGIKAAGFLDKRKYPVSPRSEAAYEALGSELDRLTQLRGRRAAAGAGGGGEAKGRGAPSPPAPQTLPTGLQPLSSSAATGPLAFSLATQQQHLQQQQRQAAVAAGGGGAKRFKPLSILVPEIPAHPIISTTRAPLPAGAAAAAAGSTAGVAREGTSHGSAPQQHHLQAASFNGMLLSSQLQQQHPHQQPPHSSQQPQHHHPVQEQGGQSGLPPRPPPLLGRLAPTREQPLQPLGNPSAAGQGLSSLPLSGPAGGAPGPLRGGPPPGPHQPLADPATAADGGSGGGSVSGLAPMDLDAAAGSGSSSAAPFAFDRRCGGGGAAGGGSDDSLLPGPSSGCFRTSLDGCAANLLSMPSPPPHGGAHALFGPLDGGPLSLRSGSHSMLAAMGLGGGGPSPSGGGLGLGMGLGMGLGGLGLESPGGPHMPLDSALRGLAPMDLLEWPSSSPRSSEGNMDNGGSGGAGGFASDEGEGGTVVDGLEVRGTALSKLAPGALEAALGPTAAESGGSAGGGGGGGTPGSAARCSGAFASPSAAAAAVAAAGSRAAQEQPLAAAAARGGGAEPAGGRSLQGQHERGSGALAAAANSSLVTELSFSELQESGSGSGGVAAAAAAALAAATARQQQQGQGAAGVGGPDLQVVGRALVLPGAAAGGAVSPGAAAGVPVRSEEGAAGHERHAAGGSAEAVVDVPLGL